jgi:hypothetical protein
MILTYSRFGGVKMKPWPSEIQPLYRKGPEGDLHQVANPEPSDWENIPFARIHHQEPESVKALRRETVRAIEETVREIQAGITLSRIVNESQPPIPFPSPPKAPFTKRFIEQVKPGSRIDPKSRPEYRRQFKKRFSAT